MARLISIDWEPDNLTGVEAHVADGVARINRTLQFDWPENLQPAESPKEAGQWLAQSLKEAGATADSALVVLPRESLVVRRLDLPNAPDTELPDLVRFQAATKSSTPLDRLALDYIPIPLEENAAQRQVLMVTVDGTRLKTIREVMAAANLDLRGVGVSPVSVAELVTRIEGEHSADPHEATLVVYQDLRRVEITIVQQRSVVFTHQLQLSGSEDGDGIRASIVEINRASVALSQSQHDVEITEVCLIHSGNADPALEQALAERFGGRLHVLDVAKARGIKWDSHIERASLAGFAPAIGMALSYDAARVPAIDFLNPRRREEAPDRTKLTLGLAAAGVVLVAGLGYGLFRWHLSGLESQIADYDSQAAELQRTLKAGAPELEAAGRIEEWVEGSRDPLSVIQELHELGPGTSRTYLKEYQQLGGSKDTVARVTGKGFAKSREDVEGLQETLEQAGYRVLPNITVPSSIDPDYPYEFQLDLHILREQPTEAAAGAAG